MQIEMFAVFPDKTWTTTTVEIPDDMPKENIEEFANKTLLADYAKKGIAVDFVGLNKKIDVPKKTNNLFPINVTDVTKLGQHAIRYLTLIVMVYVFGTMIILIYTKRGEFIDQIFTWSIVGFWTFFFGYFGTMIAQEVLTTILKHTKKK
jgi:hypothetical protein